MEKVESNRAASLKNADVIYERRQSILENHKKIAANQERITKLIAG
ncbi:MAG: hypothetical protein ACK5DW_06490 [Burkholderiales bacterium]